MLFKIVHTLNIDIIMTLEGLEKIMNTSWQKTEES